MEEDRKDFQNVVNIPPLKKFKRVLLFLADFFIVFIFALLIFHVGVNPLGRVITNFDKQETSLHEYQEKRDSVLYGNEILLEKKDNGRSYDKFDSNLEYTSVCFIRYLVLDDLIEGRDVIHHYYVDIRENEDVYISILKEVDAKTNFLEFSANEVSLKGLYKEEFLPYFNQDDTMSSKGSEDFVKFQDKVFAQAYQRVLADIREKDLGFAGISYNENQAKVEIILQNRTNLIVFGAVASYVVVWLLFMLLLPTFTKRHRTLAMIMLRIERVKQKDISEISSPTAYLGSLYFLLGGILSILFVPWGTVASFADLFSLPALFPLALISLAFILGSLAFLLFDAYNRTLGDFFTRTIMLDERDLDDFVSVTGGSGWLKKEEK